MGEAIASLGASLGETVPEAGKSYSGSDNLAQTTLCDVKWIAMLGSSDFFVQQSKQSANQENSQRSHLWAHAQTNISNGTPKRVCGLIYASR